jgi:glycosyltransferase involved in cell wall biosynthesis
MEKISIIITTKNDYENLDQCLHSLVYQKQYIYEVIVVDGDGDSLVEHRCNMYPDWIRYVNGKGTSMCQGRNRGLDNARGSLIAFIDSDTILCKSWASALLKAMESQDIVAGYTVDGEGNHRMNRVSCFVNGNDITYAGCNIAYKKKVVDTVGYYDDKLRSADDLDYNLRCVNNGFNIGYEPLMKLVHIHRKSKVGWMKQQFLYGYGRYQINKKYPGLKHETGSVKNIFRLIFGALGYVFGRYKYKQL